MTSAVIKTLMTTLLGDISAFTHISWMETEEIINQYTQRLCFTIAEVCYAIIRWQTGFSLVGLNKYKHFLLCVWCLYFNKFDICFKCQYQCSLHCFHRNKNDNLIHWITSMILIDTQHRNIASKEPLASEFCRVLNTMEQVYTLEISRYNITRYFTKSNRFECKTSSRFPTHDRHP